MVRISETVTTQARQLDFVEAARASGTTTLQVIRYHVLANVLGPILVYATSLISVSIILSAGLSFLGLGVTPPQAEWGLMLNSLRQAIYVQPYVAALPGLMIFITSMCFNLMSDGFRSRHGCEAEQMTRKRIQPPAMARSFCRCAFAVTLLSDGHSP